MVSNNQFDPIEWLQRLEAGDRSESLLLLAANIMDTSPELPEPSPAFKVELRSKLCDQADQIRDRRPIKPRWIAWGFAILMVIVLLVVGLRGLSGSTPTASAAEILNLASQRLSYLTDEDVVLYDRLLLDWEKGVYSGQDVVGELWRTPDGSQLRYQMKAGDRVIYFDQHDAEHLWRSSHIRPMEGVQVDFVYQAGYLPQEYFSGDEQLISSLLFQDFGEFWVHIDQLAGGKHADCTNPFCVISALGDGWECTLTECTLNLGPVPVAGDLIILAEVLEDDWLPNGHQVHRVRLQIAGEDDRYYQVLKFDTETYDLLEIQDFSKDKLRYRIRLDDRQVLTRSEFPEGFFQEIPDGVEVRIWESDYPLGYRSNDRVWIISADPPPEIILSEPFQANVKIGYRLTSIEKAAINLGGLNWRDHDSRVKLDVDEVIVDAGEGVIELDFVVETSDLGDGWWGMWPAFRDVLGIHLGPGIGWNSFGEPAGIYPEWCIRCQEPAEDS